MNEEVYCRCGAFFTKDDFERMKFFFKSWNDAPLYEFECHTEWNNVYHGSSIIYSC